ncbi:MAG TPA: RNA-binding cell elongation regulator Jag/EloR [Acidimicrobiales bacterium]|nr:RNA-binding cell elongation regulator Jag/EloR [Acidimicrobiales bacterium]
MEWVETTGKTLEEAEQAALEQLGVSRDDAEISVIAEPKPGLFGRMRSEARVRARVRPARPRPKEERRERQRRSNGQRGAGEGGQTDGRDGQEDDVGSVSERGQGAEEPQAGTGQVSLAEQGEVARRFLVGVLEQFGYEGTVGTRTLDDDDLIEVAVDGEGLALLIGPRGATVDALQDLTRTVIQRRTGAAQGRVVVDVAGYRRKRRSALERFTREVADEVVRSGRAQELEPMTPPDRKVVHDTANGIAGVTTRSDGEEPRRRVIVQPG